MSFKNKIKGAEMLKNTFLTPKDMCEYLHISKATLWRHIANGKLPQPTKRLSRSILLWNKSALDEMLGLNESKGAENE